jgi:hypothetical protein
VKENAGDYCRQNCRQSTDSGASTTMESTPELRAPEEIRTPNLLIRRQPRSVCDDAPASGDGAAKTRNIGSGLRSQSKDVDYSPWRSMRFGRRLLDEL